LKSRHFALAAILAVALVPAAESAVQPRTTAPPPVANIKITITDSGIHMSPKIAQRGTIGRFILVNVGKKPHTFVLGLILFLDFRGPIPYSGVLPADRNKPRMKGIFRVI
jgi:hypothetical protein